MCRSGRTVAKEGVDGRKSLLQQVISSPNAGVMSVVVVPPVANATQ